VAGVAEVILPRLLAPRFFRCFAVSAAALGLIRSAAAAPLERSVSSSRQFIVYGSERGLRAGICDLGERTKAGLLALLQQRDEWKTPIVVNVQRRAANLPEVPPARVNLSQTGFGLKLQLELTFDADAKCDAIRRELLRVLLLEMMYRDAADTPADTPYVQPPDWLVNGMLVLAAEDSSAVVESVGAMPADRKALQLREFLQQQPALLESPSRAVYAARSAAFVSMLTGFPAGRVRLARFIRKLPQASNDALADLQAQFSELSGKPEDVQQSWADTLSALSRERYGMLSCEKTERALTKLLSLEFGKPGDTVETYTLEEFPRFIRSAAAPRALQMLQQRLLVASGQANPLYAPIIAEYQRIAALLMRRKTNKIPERLARVRGDREHITRLMTSIGDYMNWFEATQTQMASGAFTEYMRAAEAASNREPRRRDAISVYLDALQAQVGD